MTYIITWQSRVVVFKYRPKIIAITGSVGKTSTKQAIFSVISAKKTVRMSEKSFYNEIGIPLAILGCYDGGEDLFMWVGTIIHGLSLIFWRHKYPEFLILEVGLRSPGDIKNKVASWLRPDVVIITRMPSCPTHIEFFDSLEKLEEEKISLVKALKKDGLLILNHDDERVYSLHERSESRTVSFGVNDSSTYQILYLIENYQKQEGNQEIQSGINFKIKYAGNTFPVCLPNVLGLHNAGIVTSALACTKELGFDLKEYALYTISQEFVVDNNSVELKNFVKELCLRITDEIDSGWQESSKREIFIKSIKQTLQALRRTNGKNN